LRFGSRVEHHQTLRKLPAQEAIMPEAIPEKYLDLFQKRAFANLATLMPNGQPQVTPVWCDFQEGHVLVNTARDRQKDRNMRRDPHVALSIQDPDNPYRYLEIRGRVTDVKEGAEAEDHIDRMAKKYMGVEKYPYRSPNEKRVLYRIEPEHTSSMG
jgi:PPOX class probable F420-dependent enzyme